MQKLLVVVVLDLSELQQILWECQRQMKALTHDVVDEVVDQILDFPEPLGLIRPFVNRREVSALFFLELVQQSGVSLESALTLGDGS